MTSLSDIVFPSASEQPNFSHLLTELKRGDLSISNRLRSIIHDADFVREVAAAFGSVEEGPTEATGTVTLTRPLVANERCGSWYIPPSTKSASAYFKSTDGHDNAWKFSTRRLNLHLLEIIGRCDGCIIVDSTRRGKRIPDALSKTIPIWCAVLNRALFPSLPEEAHALHTPPNVVSPSEHAQIAALLPSFLAAFLALDLDLAPLRAQLTKPLRPLWITPDTPLLRPQTTTTPAAPRSTVFEDAHPVICCTASRRVAGGELREGGYVYVQGAGDDTENWACGLTAELFWAHADQLLDTPEGELPALVRGLVDACEPSRGAGAKKVAPSMAMEVGVGKHKVASRNLRAALPDICGFVTRFLESQKKDDGSLAEGTTVLVACETGKDLSVAVALAICLWCFDQQDNYRAPDTKTIFNKDMVRHRLGSIMTACPEANPGRASLQSVNSFLMDYRR
ncbi:hypothetical protein VdG1_03687 [Verticillium dahliae VDG1]|nr:hypothetical protein VdG1_03687 [Verticillium dahliae VDG1]